MQGHTPSPGTAPHFPANALEIRSRGLTAASPPPSLGRGWVQGQQEEEGALWEQEGMRSYTNETSQTLAMFMKLNRMFHVSDMSNLGRG